MLTIIEFLDISRKTRSLLNIGFQHCHNFAEILFPSNVNVKEIGRRELTEEKQLSLGLRKTERKRMVDS